MGYKKTAQYWQISGATNTFEALMDYICSRLAHLPQKMAQFSQLAHLSKTRMTSNHAIRNAAFSSLSKGISGSNTRPRRLNGSNMVRCVRSREIVGHKRICKQAIMSRHLSAFYLADIQGFSPNNTRHIPANHAICGWRLSILSKSQSVLASWSQVGSRNRGTMPR